MLLLATFLVFFRIINEKSKFYHLELCFFNRRRKAKLKLRLAIAFLVVYIVWGSTYLAIRFVVETLPPFFMAGTRFIIAGLVLFVFTLLRDAKTPTRLQLKDSFVVGGLLLLGGNGTVVWAEQWVPSGLTSLLLATMPLWLILLNSMYQRKKPSIGVVLGMLLGFAGVALLVGSINNFSNNNMVAPGMLAIVFGAFLWASGSLYSRSAKTSTSQLQPAALQMIMGGTLLFVVSLITGEYTQVMLDQVSTRSLLSWLYLIVFGSLVAFSSYIWLLKQTAPSRVSTHAYINPIVAMILGTFLADEMFTIGNILAAIIIIISVVIITSFSSEQEN